MPQDLSNAASECAQTVLPFVGSLNHWPEEVKAMLRSGTEGFAYERRRRFEHSSASDLDRMILGELEAFVDVSGSPLSVSVPEVIAIRGDRVACLLFRFDFADGSTLDMVNVFLYGRTLRLQRWASFDAEDRDAAIELAERWHDTNPEPVFPGAFGAAMAWFHELEAVAQRAGAVPDSR